MISESHLYPGFRYAGALQSIQAQRSIQAQLLADLLTENLLVVGSGYGEELNELFGHRASSSDWPEVTVIDLLDVGKDIITQCNISRLRDKLSFQRLDLLNANTLAGFGSFDCVQCGFVLHDFYGPDKQNAMRMLASAVRPRGLVLISDIFVRREYDQSEVIGIYDEFIREAGQALQDGRLDYNQYCSLLGDGVQMGLVRTRREAALGERDFFEQPDSMIARAHREGLMLIDIISNPANLNLSVLLFRREFAISNPESERAGGKYVL